MQSEVQLPVAAESLKRKHEVGEKRVRNALIIGGSTAFLLISSLAACGLTIHLLKERRPMQSMTALGIIIAPNLKPLERFSQPNLQIDDDHSQMAALRAAQNDKLNSYGWVDRNYGIVHIPIERAMDLIAQQGLPANTNDISHTDGSPLELMQERPKQQ